VRLQLLHVEECPNEVVALERVEAALSGLGRDDHVEQVLISTHDEARQWSFHGSPSLLVDGVDVFAGPDDQVALACRLYRTPHGPAGFPDLEQVSEALRRASS